MILNRMFKTFDISVMRVSIILASFAFNFSVF